MEDKILKAIFISVIVFILSLFLVPYIVCESISISMGRPTGLEIAIDNIKNDVSSIVDNTIHGNKYKEKIDKYIEERFGDIVVKKLKIVKYPGNEYYCKFEEIMDNGFYVSYNKKLDECGDNFSDIISTDNKFQHLYSEWVKKQVGIDDENVEFGFTGSYDTPYVEFEKITSLSEDYREVFENTHKFKLRYIYVKQYHNLNFNNFNVYVEKFITNYYDKMITTSTVENYNDFYISLFTYGFNSNVSNSLEYDKYYGSKNNVNNYTVNIINGKIDNNVYYSYKDDLQKTKVEQINKKEYLKK